MEKKAQGLILLTGIIWGSMGILVRILGGIGLESLDMIFIRSSIITTMLFFYLLVFKKSYLKIKVCDIWCFIGTGLVSIVFYNYCYYEVIKQSSLANATIWLYTAPAFVMILSAILFKEKLATRKCISIGMTFIGCICVSGMIGKSFLGEASFKTFLLGLGAGIGYALYSIFSRYALNKGYNTVTIMFYTFLIVNISTFTMVDASSVFQIAFGNVYRAGLCCLFTIGGTLIPYLLYVTGMKYVENSKAAVLVSVEPITATVLGTMVYHENLSFLALVGVIMVLSGIIIGSK